MRRTQQTSVLFIERRPSTVRRQGEITPSEVVQSAPETVSETLQPSKETPQHQIPAPSITNQILSHPHWNTVDTSLPLAGRVAHCLDNWKWLTLDPWILQVVQGYQIEWTRTPFQVYPTITLATSNFTDRRRGSFRKEQWWWCPHIQTSLSVDFS